MKRKTIMALALAAALTAGYCAYPTVTEMASRTGLSASAVTYGTTTDGWKYTAYDTYCLITGYTDQVQGDVTFPSSITLEDQSTTLPVTGVDSIYYSHKAITGLTIPASITTLPNQFCELKNNLKSVTFEGKIIILPMTAFASCTALETVNLPEGLSEIGSSAFSGCTRLEGIKIPSSVSTIGNYAFKGCEALKSITIPGSVTSIPDSAFANCTALSSVTIEDGVKSISGGAFQNCTSLTEVTFPKSVTTVTASLIFNGCNNLESITVENPDCTLGNIAGTEEKPLIIYGYDGSTAEKYCSNDYHHCEFRSIGEKPAPEPVNDYGDFCDADGNGTVDITDAQMVLIYYVEDMAENNPSWYAITKNPKAPDAP